RTEERLGVLLALIRIVDEEGDWPERRIQRQGILHVSAGYVRRYVLHLPALQVQRCAADPRIPGTIGETELGCVIVVREPGVISVRIAVVQTDIEIASRLHI